MRDVKDYGRVAVVMGGWSAEREVSLMSGENVIAALLRKGVDAHKIDAQHDIISVLAAGEFDRVFNIMHGRGGEDGQLQGALEILQLPCTGSGILGSALAMDKLRTKMVWAGQGLPTPAWREVHSVDETKAAFEAFGAPMMIKPIFEGSSIGIAQVEDLESLPAAVEEALKYGPVLAEQFVHGMELTAGVLGERSLPLVSMSTDTRQFYDYEAKYFDDTTVYNCPCGLPDTLEQQIRALAYKAFQAVGAHGWGRVDIMLDEQQQPWLLEVNTVPGMTGHSLVPMAAEEMGIDFDTLVVEILETSMEAPE